MKVVRYSCPLTPIAWIEDDVLMWNPIEYIGEYIVLKDGKEVARDGRKEGLVVMPQRGSGNWLDLGWSNSVPVNLTAGQHTLTLTFTSDNENMNIQTNHAKVYAVRLVADDK